ncbi:hypothetical protein NML63_08680 [Streptococcus sp. CF9-1]|jgi:hypothetical protein|uniref:hypothetical protein n=1 Tax=unclassified Streptococcus TaxID=2608887 RepID=UPI0020C85B5D|nr:MULTISPECIES: hypothetical protein [unclassified Streptococcus]MCP8994737.1 hypothetical protein [Streptococcus sp. CF9-3]MCP8998121.1 hypothetical protein [Streptococcus sp. CF9-1]
MKKIKIILWLMIGGIMLMTAALLNGCSLGGETIPKNRTKEQYEFEKTFEPMFKFLEQEKKDFTGLKSYTSDVYIKNQAEVKNYEVDLDINQADIKGDYTITLGEDKETVPVTYSNGKLNYESEINPLFDEEILNLMVSRDYFASLDVEKTFKSAETELSDIIYEPENQSELYKKIVEKYNLPSDTKFSVSLGYAYYDRYDILLSLESKEKLVQISAAFYLVKGK